MDILFNTINGFWDGINDIRIFDTNDMYFTIGELLIAMFMITICITFIRIVIKGKGDKADG